MHYQLKSINLIGTKLPKIERTYDIHVSRRVNEDVPFITDNGNYILDCSLQNRIPAYELHEFLIHLTGVLETGYFLDIADQVIVEHKKA